MGELAAEMGMLPPDLPSDGVVAKGRKRAASDIMADLCHGITNARGEMVAERYHQFTAADVPGLRKLEAMVQFFQTHPAVLRQFNAWYGAAE